MNLLGEFPVAIDSKGRLRVPSGLLRQLGEKPAGEGAYSFVVNRGFEKYLTLWPKDSWEINASKVRRLDQFNEKNRRTVRSFFAGVTIVETDSADRILLQKPQMDYAGLKDEAILICMDDRIEIWSPEAYEENINFDPAEYSKLANEVLGGGEEGVGRAGNSEITDILK